MIKKKIFSLGLAFNFQMQTPLRLLFRIFVSSSIPRITYYIVAVLLTSKKEKNKQQKKKRQYLK